MEGLVEERRLLEGWIKLGMDGRISRGKKTPVRRDTARDRGWN